MKKRKILIFSLAYYPKHIGGAEVAIKEITDRLDVNQYEFHLVCNRYDSTLPKTEQVGNILVHRIGLTTTEPTMADLRKLPLHLNKIIYQWQAFWIAKRLHRKYQFDGVWAMMSHSCGVPAAKFKHAFPNCKYVLTLQEGDPPEYIERKMRFFQPWFDRAFSSADCIQVISNFLGKWALQKGFSGKVVHIPNAVNTKHFTQVVSAEEKAEVRRAFGVADDDVLLVTTSRLVKKNAVDDVIRAIALLPDTVKFIVFGVGPDEEYLRKQAQEVGVADRVLFRGQIGHEEMPRYLKSCNIFIRPSRSEGMGNSFIEAMAAELPVIATQVGGIEDFLFDEKRNPNVAATGWAVEVNSPQQITQAVQQIINYPEKTSAVVAEAKKMAVEKYDWNLIAERMNQEVFSPLFSEE